MAILFVPLVFGLKALYPWARPELLADDTLLQHKQAYLNAPFFLIRAGLYFGVWTGVGYALNRWSPRQDATSGDRLTSRIKRLSGFGLVAYGGTVTFATIDWGMSLEPHWFSTMYGVIFIIGNALTTMALMIVMLGLVSRQKPLSNLVSAQHFHDLGNLLLAFVMLWAYIAFSQYLIIWSGNLAEEATWYAPRMAGGWKPVAMMLIGFHFIVPFLLLLSRNTKRRTQAITAVALFVLAMRLVDLFWLVAPAFHKEGFHLHWLDIAAPLGVGGLWLGVFIWQLQKRPLLPMGDPRLVEILSQREDAHHA